MISEGIQNIEILGWLYDFNEIFGSEEVVTKWHDFCFFSCVQKFL